MSLLVLAVMLPLAQAGWVLDDYRAFRDGGCDADEEGIYSPVVLRVLRSTPQAEAGMDFVDDDLHLLFGADGGWYVPRPGKTVRVPEKDQLCVAKIRAWEDQQRQMHCIEDGHQATLTADIDLYRWHRQDMGLPEMHRYMQGMIPENRPQRSACGVSKASREALGGRWVEWSLDMGTVRRPSVSQLEDDYRRLFPDDEAGEPSADFVDRMKRWEQRQTPVERLEWSADQIEGNPGDEPFRRKDQGVCWGEGTFMDQTWFCLESGSF